MNLNQDHVTRLLENQYAKISEIRKAIGQLTEAENPTPLHENWLQDLQEKEAALSVLYKQKTINFQPVKAGFLALGGKPGVDRLAELTTLNTTTVVTLLKEKETGVAEIKAAVTEQGIDWIWFPLSASQLSLDPEFRQKINELYHTLIQKLEAGERIFVHCAAGVHRTGSFSNGLLRKMGFTQEESRTMIYAIRPVTALEAVKKHWAWSEAVIQEEF